MNEDSLTTAQNSLDDSKMSESNEENLPKRQKVGKTLIAKAKKSTVNQVRGSFCMNLFGKNVNLGKFNESSPLYPICREWMKNIPRNSKPQQRVEETKEEILPRKDCPTVLRMIQNGIRAEIRFLPPLDHILGLTKVPELMDFQKDLDKNKLDVQYTNMTKDDLLRSHKKRWSIVGAHWKSHHKKYSSQYAGSFEILDAIIEK